MNPSASEFRSRPDFLVHPSQFVHQLDVKAGDGLSIVVKHRKVRVSRETLMIWLGKANLVLGMECWLISGLSSACCAAVSSAYLKHDADGVAGLWKLRAGWDPGPRYSQLSWSRSRAELASCGVRSGVERLRSN